MSKKRDKTNKTAQTNRKPEPMDEAYAYEPEQAPQARRDFAIDLAGIHYGLDSDEIDELENHYARLGAPLVSMDDYRRAFDAYAFAMRSPLPGVTIGDE